MRTLLVRLLALMLLLTAYGCAGSEPHITHPTAGLHNTALEEAQSDSAARGLLATGDVLEGAKVEGSLIFDPAILGGISPFPDYYRGSPNLFDPANRGSDDTQKSQWRVPDTGYGNSAGLPAGGIAVTSTQTEFGFFGTFDRPASGPNYLMLNVDLNTTGLITLEQYVGTASTLSPQPYTIKLKSPAFQGLLKGAVTTEFNQLWRNIPGQSVDVNLAGDELSFVVGTSVDNSAGETKATVSVQLEAPPPPCDASQACCNKDGTLVSAATKKQCSEATECKQASLCNGTSATCPAARPKPNLTACTWRPNGRNGYAMGAAHEQGPEQPTENVQKVSADQAAAWLASSPAYDDHRWPDCEGSITVGRCYDGVCALRSTHPACCFVDLGEDEYPGNRYGGHPYSTGGDSTSTVGTADHQAATKAVIRGVEGQSLSEDEQEDVPATVARIDLYGYWRNKHWYCWK